MINILSADFAVIRAKPANPYLGMLQSFAPWKSAFKELKTGLHLGQMQVTKESFMPRAAL